MPSPLPSRSNYASPRADAPDHGKRTSSRSGLSAGFLEPLESTSIHLIQHGIQKLIGPFPSNGINPVERDEYNRQYGQRLRAGARLHHPSLSCDTPDRSPFWDYVREMHLPDSLGHKLELFRQHGHVFRYNEELFDIPSWVAVMIGQDVIPLGYDPLVDGMPDRDVLCSNGRACTALRPSRAPSAARERLHRPEARRRLVNRCGRRFIAKMHLRATRRDREHAQHCVADRWDDQRSMVARHLRESCRRAAAPARRRRSRCKAARTSLRRWRTSAQA